MKKKRKTLKGAFTVNFSLDNFVQYGNLSLESIIVINCEYWPLLQYPFRNWGVYFFLYKVTLTLTLLLANNKGTDQPAHARSLVSAFVIRYLKVTRSDIS